MATKAAVACVGTLLMASVLAAVAQDATPARTARPAEAESVDGYQVAKQQRNRVQLRNGYLCTDPATTRIAPGEIEQVVARFPAPKTLGLVHPERTYTVPMASYPTEQLNAGNPGAALVMISIREDGSVEDARAVCATDEAFGKQARETALSNRYRAAELHGVPVSSLAFQTVTYAVEED